MVKSVLGTNTLSRGKSLKQSCTSKVKLSTSKKSSLPLKNSIIEHEKQEIRERKKAILADKNLIKKVKSTKKK